MLKLKTELRNFVTVWSGELAAVKAGVTRAIDVAAAGLQTQLRSDTVTAGLGQGNANAWRMQRYPRGRDSLNAAAIVWSRSPAVIDGFNRGAVITHRGGRYLTIPTNFNRVGGRRRAKVEGRGQRNYWTNVRVTPAQMVRSREAFVIPNKDHPGQYLWCLRVKLAQRKTAKRGKVKDLAFAGGLNVQVGTAHRLNATAALLAAGFVPMFVLLRQVKLDKRLDLDRRADEAAAAVAAQITRELG